MGGRGVKRAAGLEIVGKVMDTETVLIKNKHTRHEALVERIHKRTPSHTALCHSADQLISRWCGAVCVYVPPDRFATVVLASLSPVVLPLASLPSFVLMRALTAIV